MLQRGEPLIYKPYGHSDKVVIYHSGGGCGGQKAKVWIPDGTDKGLVPRASSTLKTLNGKDFEDVVKEPIVRQWDLELPDNIKFEPHRDAVPLSLSMSSIEDYAQCSRQAHLFTTPREQWKTLFGGDGVLKTLPAVKTRLDRGARHVFSEVGLRLRVDYARDVEVSLTSTEEMNENKEIFWYTPGVYESQRRARAMDQLKKVIDAYFKEVGGGPNAT